MQSHEMEFWLFTWSLSSMPLILNGNGEFQVSIMLTGIGMFVFRQYVSALFQYM